MKLAFKLLTGVKKTYRSKPSREMGRETGFEPATTGITIRGCVTFTLPNKLERVTLPTVHFIHNPCY